MYLDDVSWGDVFAMRVIEMLNEPRNVMTESELNARIQKRILTISNNGIK